MPPLRPLLLPLLLTAFAIHAVPAQTVRQVGAGGFDSIQAAIDASAPGDVVLIHAGAYRPFDIDKSLVITAVPSALVQIGGNLPMKISLQPHERVHLAGLDLQVRSLATVGGIVSLERCTLRTIDGMRVSNGIATFRWSSAGAQGASGVLVTDGALHASDSTFSTAAAGIANIEHGAVKLMGVSNCLLSLCTLIGAWPSDVNAPWPSVALHTSRADPSARTWMTDCNLQGGFHATGPLGPALVTASLGAPRVRVHRTQVSGLAIGIVDTGPVVGLHTPVDMTIGSTFTTTMRGEPGNALLFYVGLDVAGPVQLPFVEQPAFGFLDTIIFPIGIANALGEANFDFPVPNNPALRHMVLWWRGLDLMFMPWHASPVFITVTQ